MEPDKKMNIVEIKVDGIPVDILDRYGKLIKASHRDHYGDCLLDNLSRGITAMVSYYDPAAGNACVVHGPIRGRHHHVVVTDKPEDPFPSRDTGMVRLTALVVFAEILKEAENVESGS